MKKYDKEAKEAFEWFCQEHQGPVTIEDFDLAYSELLRAMLTRSAETPNRAALLE